MESRIHFLLYLLNLNLMRCITMYTINLHFRSRILDLSESSAKLTLPCTEVSNGPLVFRILTHMSLLRTYPTRLASFAIV